MPKSKQVNKKPYLSPSAVDLIDQSILGLPCNKGVAPTGVGCNIGAAADSCLTGPAATGECFAGTCFWSATQGCCASGTDPSTRVCVTGIGAIN